MKLNPLWKHDCDACKFLGTRKNLDWYVCEEGALGRSIIARYSDEGPDYACRNESLLGTGEFADTAKELLALNP